VSLEAKRHERRHRGEVCEVDADHWMTASPADRIDPFEWDDVVAVMSRLAEFDRALLSDRFLGGMTEQQIADCRGMSKSFVHKHLGIAIKRAMSISRCCG
jgi:DNA-directed RNA polymerase specialized sigma24 family protein